MGVDEWLVEVIKSMYAGASTSAKSQCRESSNQGSVLSPLLFVIALEELSRMFRQGLPWELSYADGLALIAESSLNW